MKIPVFTIEPLLKSIHFEQVGYQRATFKEARSLKKADKVIRKSLKTPARWVYIKHSDKTHPVLLNTSGDVTKIISGPKSLLLKSAKTEKDLEYWKKKLLDSLKMEKSLEEIFFPTMYKSLPEKAEEQIKMLKARGYDVGTVREWRGKKYKKMGSGKWVRSYSEAESRGAKQAIRNVKKKILNAKTMQELVDIVKENKSRFMGEDGKALPIIKEFMEAARITDAGKKEDKKIDSSSIDVAEKIISLGGREWKKNGMERVYINNDILNTLREEKGYPFVNYGERNNKIFYDKKNNAIMRSYKGKKPQQELEM